VISNSLEAEFFHLSWVLSKKEDVVKIIAKAQRNFHDGRQTILFLDEIHRWSKSQQDVLLPWVEKWIITLIGATTENPSFTVINALLSRSRTYILEPIWTEDIVKYLERNMEKIQERYPGIVFKISKMISWRMGVRGEDTVWTVMNTGTTISEAGTEWVLLREALEIPLGYWLPTETFDTFGHKSMGKKKEDHNNQWGTETSSAWQKHDSLTLIAKLWNGDLRNTMNILETACILQGTWEISRETILEAGAKSLNYDRDGEEHHNLISAMHKSLRDSDWDAAIYWIGRMLAGGEDPRYIARRMMNFASEDIYDTHAIVLTNSIYEICEKMGMPECELPLLNVAYYLANAPKDNRVYMAMQAMHSDIREYWTLGVPLHLRNAPTELMKEAGYGKWYEYAHNLEGKKSEQEHFPDELKGRKYR
jgi:putative ATPase